VIRTRARARDLRAPKGLGSFQPVLAISSFSRPRSPAHDPPPTVFRPRARARARDFLARGGKGTPRQIAGESNR
jgi:hypothetical protein